LRSESFLVFGLDAQWQRHWPILQPDAELRRGALLQRSPLPNRHANGHPHRDAGHPDSYPDGDAPADLPALRDTHGNRLADALGHTQRDCHILPSVHADTDRYAHANAKSGRTRRAPNPHQRRAEKRAPPAQRSRGR